MVFEARQTHHVDIALRRLATHQLLAPAQQQVEGNVFPHRQPWHQIGVLEDHATIGAGRSDCPSIDCHLTCARLLEARDHILERGFSTAGGAEQAEKLVLLDRQSDVVERNDIGLALQVTKSLADVRYLDRRHLTPPRPEWWYCAASAGHAPSARELPGRGESRAVRCWPWRRARGRSAGNNRNPTAHSRARSSRRPVRPSRSASTPSRYQCP